MSDMNHGASRGGANLQQMSTYGGKLQGAHHHTSWVPAGADWESISPALQLMGWTTGEQDRKLGQRGHSAAGHVPPPPPPGDDLRILGAPRRSDTPKLLLGAGMRSSHCQIISRCHGSWVPSRA